MEPKNNRPIKAYLGLDAGSSSLDLVLIDDDCKILESSYHIVNSDRSSTQDTHGDHCAKACDKCGNPCGMEFIVQKVDDFISSCRSRFNVSIEGFVGTGSQVRQDITFSIPLDLLVSEISAHGRGMRHASNTQDVSAIIDVGGQDSKVIRLSHPMEFHMSGMCAAGTGAYLDEIARVENMSVSDFGAIGGQFIENYIKSLGTDRPARIEYFSSVCTVFTKSSYVRKKGTLNIAERAGAICWAQARQIHGTVIHHLRGYSGKISFQGGVSFNEGVRRALDFLLRKELNHSDDGSVLVIPEIDDYCDSEGRRKPVSHLMGALGAALLAREFSHSKASIKSTQPECPPLEATRKRKEFFKKQFQLAHSREKSRPLVAWCGTLFPSELCYLFDIVPIALPVLAAVDHRNAQEYLVKAVTDEGLDRANCTILSSVLGRLDKTPPPDFFFFTSGSCDYYRQHVLRMTEIAKEHFGLDPGKRVCSIDLPTYSYRDELGVKFVGNQLRDAVSRIEDALGKKHDPDKLRKIIHNVNEAREYHVRTEELRARSPALAFGGELLKRTVLYNSGWGSDEFVDIARSFYTELKERARIRSSRSDDALDLGEKHRILWVYLWDYADPMLLPYLESQLNCVIVGEELNYIHWPPMDPENPFDSIARRIVQPINNVDDRMAYLMKMAETYRVDGIVFFVHFFGHCPLASESFQNMLRKCDYPVLFLEGDLIDKSRQPSSTYTKMQAFAEQLNKMKYGNIFGV